MNDSLMIFWVYSSLICLYVLFVLFVGRLFAAVRDDVAGNIEIEEKHSLPKEIFKILFIIYAFSFVPALITFLSK